MTRAAEILATVYPQIVGFDATGLTTEERHYFLGGEAAGVAYEQYLVLTKGDNRENL
jgi:hypothetical protein